MYPVCLKGVSDNLDGLFDRVGPQENVGKAVRTIYRPCRAAGTQSETSFERQMAEEWLTYRSI